MLPVRVIRLSVQQPLYNAPCRKKKLREKLKISGKFYLFIHLFVRLCTLINIISLKLNWNINLEYVLDRKENYKKEV